MKYLSVIIPVYNEVKTISRIIEKTLKALPKKSEIIVINDGSHDGTRDKLKKFSSNRRVKVFHLNLNQGKGKAIRLGLKKSTGKILLIQDADLEYDPKYYPKLLAPIESGKSQVVYGSRLKHLPLNLSTIQTIPLPLNFIANKLLSWLTNLLYGSNLTDMETCYKVFTHKVYNKLKLTKNGFDIEAEITAQILKLGFLIQEVSITTKPRTYNQGKKIRWTDGIHAVNTLLHYKVN